METFLWSIAAAAVPAAAWIAYMHPREYAQFIWFPIIVIIVIGGSCGIAYTVARVQTNWLPEWWLVTGGLILLYMWLLVFLEPEGITRKRPELTG
jgi:hypothetical protein